MKIIYIHNTRIPTEKAHGLQIIKMCEAFSRLGEKVELWLPQRKAGDIFEYYNIKRSFRARYFFSLNFLSLERYFGRLAFYATNLAYLLALALKPLDKQDLFYTREVSIAWLLKLRGRQVVYEAHYWPESKNRVFKFLIKKVDKIIAITRGLGRELEKNGLAAKHILIAPDGVDLEKFDIKLTKQAAREKLNLSQDKNIIGYTGHLYEWKGVDTLVGSLEYLDKNTIVCLIGGRTGDIEKYKNKYKEYIASGRLLFAGFKKHEDMPIWQKAMDVLVLPNSAKENISKIYTSPLKLFEYMASSRPIVASSLPSIKEVLTEQTAVFFSPDDASDLSAKIKKIISDKDLADRISYNARQGVEKYTWKKRAERILEFAKLRKDQAYWDKYTAKKGATSFSFKYFEKYAKGKILDIGCGDGTHAAVAARFGEVSAFDYSPEVIERAKQKYPEIHFYPGSAYELPFQDNYFDFIYSVDVIEHLDEPEKCFKEVARVLKPGGVFVAQTPNYPIKRLYDFYHAFNLKSARTSFQDDPTHVSKFNFSRLQKMANKYFKEARVEARNLPFENKLKTLQSQRGNLIGKITGQKIILLCKK